MMTNDEFEDLRSRWTGISISSPRRGALPDVLALIELVDSLQVKILVLENLPSGKEIHCSQCKQILEPSTGGWCSTCHGPVIKI